MNQKIADVTFITFYNMGVKVRQSTKGGKKNKK